MSMLYSKPQNKYLFVFLTRFCALAHNFVHSELKMVIGIGCDMLFHQSSFITQHFFYFTNKLKIKSVRTFVRNLFAGIVKYNSVWCQLGHYNDT